MCYYLRGSSWKYDMSEYENNCAYPACQYMTKFPFWRSKSYRILIILRFAARSHVPTFPRRTSSFCGLQNLLLSVSPSSFIFAVSFPAAIRKHHVLIDAQWSRVRAHVNRSKCAGVDERTPGWVHPHLHVVQHRCKRADQRSCDVISVGALHASLINFHQRP